MQCTTKNKISYRLSITLDSTFDFNLLDATALTSKNFISVKHGSDTTDTVSNISFYHWDSLIEGDYQFEISTIFGGKQLIEFSLNKDTFILVENKSRIEHVKLVDINSLKSIDTIEFAYVSHGCFHRYTLKTSLIKDKENNNYRLKSESGFGGEEVKTTDVKKSVSNEIIDSLFALQLSTIPPPTKPGKLRIGYCSTTTQHFYLKAGNQLFYFNDIFFYKEWIEFKNFKDQFINETKN